MKPHFETNPDYQLAAIESVCDRFQGEGSASYRRGPRPGRVLGRSGGTTREKTAHQ